MVIMHKHSVLANAAEYSPARTKEYVHGAPHVNHIGLRRLYKALATVVIEQVGEGAPHVLDLGAGEGSATAAFLNLGAHVTAVDLSGSQLRQMVHNCGEYASQLEIREAEVMDFLSGTEKRFNIVVCSSFLHHVPDYLGLIRQALRLLLPCGVFFSFQDPLRYDSLSAFQYYISKLSYFAWRAFQPDLLPGISRRWRRARGVYLPDCAEDNAEYHITRNGVDQDAIAALLRSHGFDCRVVRYFSTQSGSLQFVGTKLGCENTFAIVAKHLKAGPSEKVSSPTSPMICAR
jgi:SAM-dependent methyltransferase